MSTASDSFKMVLACGTEITVKMTAANQRPTGSHIVLFCVGTLESPALLTLDSQITELPGDLDMPLLQEAINLQFRVDPIYNVFGVA